MQILPTLLKNKYLVILLSCMVIALGVWSWLRLPVDAFPDVSNTQVMILTKAPGLAAVDVEQQISFPIEQSVRGLPKVIQVRSLSKAELSQVVVIFEDGVDTYWSRQIVFERLNFAKDQLPASVESELGPISTGLGEIFQYTLESDSVNPIDLRTIQDWLVAPLLKPIPGVNEVNSFGGGVKQYQVLVSPNQLLKYGLTIQDVAHSVERNNGNAGGGVVVRDWEQQYLRGVGLLKDIPDLEKIVLKVHDGTPVLLKDIADIQIGAEPRQGAVTRDGKGEVVAGMIIMLKGENSKAVVSRVKETIERVKQTLPQGVRLSVFYDRTSLIEACVRTVTHALMEGGIFVILILFLFVAEFRTALIVLFSLPFTFLISFIVMGATGVSSNLMSLGGLAFSVGMVVDASIVVVENIRRHFAENSDITQRTSLIIRAVREVAKPVAFSIFIIVIILVPLFTLQGIEGKMFIPLAVTMLIALLVSLLVALTVIPVLAQTFLKQEPERGFRFVKRFHQGYRNLLDRVLTHPKPVLVTSVMLLLIAIGLIPLIGTEFMPPLNEGAIAINVVRLPNASLQGSVQVAGYLEKRLSQYPEVETVVSKTGRAEISEDPMGPEQTDVFVMLKPRKFWKKERTQPELVIAMEKDLSQIPGLRYSFSQPIALRVNELISGVKSDLAVKIFGSDLDTLKQYADRVSAIITGVEGASDIKVEQITGLSQLDVEIDRSALARYGIQVSDIHELIETAVAGKPVTTFVEGQKRFAVVVRYPERERSDMAQLERLLVPSISGAYVPLHQLAHFKVVESPAQISRENGIRRVVVETNVRGRALGGFVADVQKNLTEVIQELPSGYTISYGGQFENQQRAMKQLSIVVPIVLFMILILLYFALGNFKNSLLVLLNLPFALIGGYFAMLLFGMSLSVSAAIAYIILLGIAVQNGVVLVAFFRQLSEQGHSLEDTVREGSNLRFRPLLMTALTSFIGHLPMIYASGSGADIQKPLAVIVMGGIVTSTMLTLFVLPALYVYFHRKNVVDVME